MRAARLALVLLTLLVLGLHPAWAADAGAARLAAADAAVAAIAGGSDGGDAASDAGAVAPPDGGAVDTEDGTTGPRLRVGVAGDPPFVVHRDEELTGIAVELFREIAKDNRLAFDLIAVESVPEGLLSVEKGELDVLVGDVSITAARAERMRFTQPYFRSALGIATQAAESSYFSKIAPFFTKAFFVATAVLLGVLMIVGTLVWLVERKRNPDQFPVAPARGIANGVWFALVTMTTVGYGDRAPITGLGRIISGVWMVIALITASSLTAGIATALTLATLSEGGIESIDQLARQKVAVVAGTPAIGFAKQTRVRTVPVENMEAGLTKLKNGEVKGVLFDRPQLIFFDREHPEEDVVVSRASYQPQSYGFALPLDSKLQHRMNLSLLRLEEREFTRKLNLSWLGPDGEQRP